MAHAAKDIMASSPRMEVLTHQIIARQVTAVQIMHFMNVAKIMKKTSSKNAVCISELWGASSKTCGGLRSWYFGVCIYAILQANAQITALLVTAKLVHDLHTFAVLKKSALLQAKPTDQRTFWKIKPTNTPNGCVVEEIYLPQNPHIQKTKKSKKPRFSKFCLVNFWYPLTPGRSKKKLSTRIANRAPTY